MSLPENSAHFSGGFKEPKNKRAKEMHGLLHPNKEPPCTSHDPAEAKWQFDPADQDQG